LAGERSPYLQEHATNPVDWYPWGDEAFKKAKSEDKPIFLSIGYSSCHWCHRMREESFEDPGVAQMMNDAFVNIKVDREERPDVDAVYMSVCQMMTGSGGWPLTIIMTPEKKPFMAATFIPKEDSFGRMGMLRLVPRVKKMWKEERVDLTESADQIASSLAASAASIVPGDPDEAYLKLAFGELNQAFDKEDGGFGDAPKFPVPHNYMFLLRYWLRTGDARALKMVEKSLTAMSSGGLQDQLGHGFHRYSTDRRWEVPHFEKMLYDQAMMVMAYSEAFQVTRRAEFAKVVEDTVEYLLRNLKSAEGGFFASEDADSEGLEGRFYLWTWDEFRSCLGDEEAELLSKVFGVRKPTRPNSKEEEDGPAMSVLQMRRPAREWAGELGMSTRAFEAKLRQARARLLAVRELREHPKKDEKILADWNGLVMAALAKASRALGRKGYADEAKGISDFILSKMQDKEGRLLHMFKGRASTRGSLDDYAFIIWGLLELYEASFDVSQLKSALALAKEMIAHFWDDSSRGFFFTADDAEEVLVRQKLFHDGATPSGNSVASYDLLRLASITSDADSERTAVDTLKAANEMVVLAPSGYTMLLSALDYFFGPSNEIVISGRKGSPDASAMLERIEGAFLPNAVILFRDVGDDLLVKVAPFSASMVPVRGAATAYVCQNRACLLPTTDPEVMMASLALRRPPSKEGV